MNSNGHIELPSNLITLDMLCVRTGLSATSVVQYMSKFRKTAPPEFQPQYFDQFASLLPEELTYLQVNGVLKTKEQKSVEKSAASKRAWEGRGRREDQTGEVLEKLATMVVNQQKQLDKQGAAMQTILNRLEQSPEEGSEELTRDVEVPR